MNSSRPTALLVEDEAVIRMLLKEKLKAYGVDVIAEAGNAQEAMAVAETVTPDFIFLDFDLGGKLNGLDVAKRIRQTRNTPIIFSTAFCDEDTLSEIHKLPNVVVTSKPFDDDELNNAIEKLSTPK